MTKKASCLTTVTLLFLSFLLMGAGCLASPSTSVSIASQPVTATQLPPTQISAQATVDPSPTVSLSPTSTLLVSPTANSLIVTPVPSPPQPSKLGGIRYVVIISVDGLRPDAIEQADTPTLDALRVEGAYSPSAKTVLPSVTLVSHASMLGGMSPAKHGIYWNSNDPELGKINGPTLFSVAHAADLNTAMVVGKPKFEHLVLPDSVDDYLYAGFTDQQVVKKAVAVIQTDMPDLLFIHLPDVDSAGHLLGWMSPAQLMALNMTDSLIGAVVAALQDEDYFDQTLLIITADHGGSGLDHGSDSPEDMTIPWLAVGPGVPPGTILQSEIVTYDTAATALYALGLSIPSEWDGQPVMEIFEPDSQ